jgi:CRP-like cAMP-binding protein
MNNFTPFKTWLTQVSFLKPEDCDIFEPFLTTKKLKAKTYFLTEGKICKEIGFINSGALRTFYLSNGKEINTQFCFENQFIVDYDSFLNEKPSRYFIQTMEATELICFNLHALQYAYQQSQNWERLGRVMAEQSFSYTAHRVESFMFLDGEQRYLQLLKEEPEIFNRVPLYHIASYIGLERESLSRLRKKIAGK